MAELKEITSTEKLLDFIRNKTDAKSREETASAPSKGTPHGGKFSKIISFKKGPSGKPIFVGVDIGRNSLHMVKTAKGASGANDLIDRRSVDIPPSLNKKSAEFAGFLKTELDSFCSREKNQQLWAVMSSANVEVHHIRIPKVPKKQIENVVYWTVKKEAPFDEKENIFDFEVMGEIVEQGITKLSVMYYTVPRHEAEEAKKIFSLAGWPLTGLSITPFAVQNILLAGLIPDYEETLANLFIGNDFSRIDIYSKGKLVMTRDIKAGISSMLESLMEGLAGKAPGEAEQKADEAWKILLSLGADSPHLEGDGTGYGLAEEDIWQMILPALERLVRQVERTFEYYTVNLGNEKVVKLYVSTAIDMNRRIMQYFGEQLNIDSGVFDPLSHYSHRLDNNSALPYSLSERVAVTPALGIAFSDNMHTPNFLFTYKDKEREASVKRINMIIFAAFAASVSLCSVLFLYQLSAMDQRHKTVLRLEKQLSQYNPPLNSELIMRTVSAVKQDVVSAKAYYRRYQGLAIISELSGLASPDVKLISLKTKPVILPGKNVAAAVDKAAVAQTRTVENSKEVELEGFVIGNKKSLDTALAAYAMKLDGSPMFQQVQVQKMGEGVYKNMASLRFVINMKLEGL